MLIISTIFFAQSCEWLVSYNPQSKFQPAPSFLVCSLIIHKVLTVYWRIHSLTISLTIACGCSIPDIRFIKAGTRAIRTFISIRTDGLSCWIRIFLKAAWWRFIEFYCYIFPILWNVITIAIRDKQCWKNYVQNTSYSWQIFFIKQHFTKEISYPLVLLQF